MVKRIFKTKIIYYINIAFNIIYFLLVVDELKFLLDGKLPSEDSKYKILMTMIYVLYFLIYSFNLIILFSKFKKSIFYLNFSFILLIFINIADYFFHYYSSNFVENRELLIVALSIIILIVLTLIFFNNKYKFVLDYKEMEQIGQKEL